jgi:hypothetical protein
MAWDGVFGIAGIKKNTKDIQGASMEGRLL